MKMKFNKTLVSVLVCSSLTSISLKAAETAATEYSPYANDTLPRQVLWGDTHLHTSYSADAGFMNYRVGPEQAYRFAKGEQVTANNGMKLKLVRPLDFLVVADHSEYLGLVPALMKGNPDILKTEPGQRWAKALQSRDYKTIYGAAMEVIRSVASGNALYENNAFTRSVWEDVTASADKENEPGKFTAFIGFEWTSMVDHGSNLHRVVMYKDDAQKANAMLPFTSFESVNPEDLWQYMADYEAKTGGNILAIPHNSNVSNGKMFAVETYQGKAIDKAYAQTRAAWEPVVEVTQIKGDSETHPMLSPNDEFADFGTWDKVSLDGTLKKEPWMLQYEYARNALKNGLKIENDVGANPFKFGMIGSTDSHTGLATTREENFFGKHSGIEPDNHRAKDKKIIDSPLGDEYTTWGWEQISGGLAAVWSRENTRESIFEAFERKEVYGTTGTRITLRVFGGWDFSEQDVNRPERVDLGYEKGVPMGGDLVAQTHGRAPSLMIWATKDPDGANLDRLQVVKGWLDQNGQTHEKVYNVAWSGKRTPDKNGKLPAVGNTVDLGNATYSNEIGEESLKAVWTDPDFDKGQRAFYYVRAMEIPTPSWVVFDQVRLGAEVDERADKIIQERAYSSPIWYTPAK